MASCCDAEREIASYTNAMGAMLLIDVISAEGSELLRSIKCVAPRRSTRALLEEDAVVMMVENPAMRANWITGRETVGRDHAMERERVITKLADTRASP